MAMATGNVGSSLRKKQTQVSTYFTRDGGVTWKEIAKGSHIYEFGDHGGIIIIVKDTVPTDTLLYSFDHAQSFSSFKFTDKKILVNNVIVERSAKSSQFLLYGTRGIKSAVKSVMFHLDFSSTLPPCAGSDSPGQEESDFEYWTPSTIDNSCMLGHKYQYARRRQNARCITGKLHASRHVIDHCECTEND